MYQVGNVEISIDSNSTYLYNQPYPALPSPVPCSTASGQRFKLHPIAALPYRYNQLLVYSDSGSDMHDRAGWPVGTHIYVRIRIRVLSTHMMCHCHVQYTGHAHIVLHTCTPGMYRSRSITYNVHGGTAQNAAKLNGIWCMCTCVCVCVCVSARACQRKFRLEPVCEDYG